MTYDRALRQVGEFGRYQRRIYLLLCLPIFTSAMQVMVTVFILGTPKHRSVSPPPRRPHLYLNTRCFIKSSLHSVVHKSLSLNSISSPYPLFFSLICKTLANHPSFFYVFCFPSPLPYDFKKNTIYITSPRSPLLPSYRLLRKNIYPPIISLSVLVYSISVKFF